MTSDLPPLTQKERDEIFDKIEKRYGAVGLENANLVIAGIFKNASSYSDFVIKRNQYLRGFEL